MHPVGRCAYSRRRLFLDRGIHGPWIFTELLREQLQKVGIEMVMQPLDKPTASKRVWINFDSISGSGPSSQGSDPPIGI